MLSINLINILYLSTFIDLHILCCYHYLVFCLRVLMGYLIFEIL